MNGSWLALHAVAPPSAKSIMRALAIFAARSAHTGPENNRKSSNESRVNGQRPGSTQLGCVGGGGELNQLRRLLAPHYVPPG